MTEKFDIPAGATGIFNSGPVLLEIRTTCPNHGTWVFAPNSNGAHDAATFIHNHAACHQPNAEATLADQLTHHGTDPDADPSPGLDASASSFDEHLPASLDAYEAEARTHGALGVIAVCQLVGEVRRLRAEAERSSGAWDQLLGDREAARAERDALPEKIAAVFDDRAARLRAGGIGSVATVFREAARVARAFGAPNDRRDPECVKRWPECSDGYYHQACCRFPKACSCEQVPEPSNPGSVPVGASEVVSKSGGFDGQVAAGKEPGVWSMPKESTAGVPLPRTLSEALEDPALARITAYPDAVPKRSAREWAVRHGDDCQVSGAGHIAHRRLKADAEESVANLQCAAVLVSRVPGGEWEAAE